MYAQPEKHLVIRCKTQTNKSLNPKGIYGPEEMKGIKNYVFMIRNDGKIQVHHAVQIPEL